MEVKQKILRLGTRRSLLALTQSQWVAHLVEKLNPQLKVELIHIETRGDQVLDVALRSLEGKDFFVAELDRALLEGKVDFTVHSLKDLSLDRPKEIRRAAVPGREDPHDVVVWGPTAVEGLRAGRALRVGTSSPRRLENVPSFLKEALPRLRGSSIEPALEWVDLRGNVNTRLLRLLESEGSERHLDGVVLALAGLNRLWNSVTGARTELEPVLNKCHLMVLPVAQCPAAPGQGALAVECRANDEQLFSILEKLHDHEVAISVDRERQIWSEQGGGCHQRFGATEIRHEKLGRILYVRGVGAKESVLNELYWQEPFLKLPSHPKDTQIWDGTIFAHGGLRSEKMTVPDKDVDGFVFVAHHRAAQDARFTPGAHVWTSGTSSWFSLARRGVWVEGCAEGLGVAHVMGLWKRATVLQLPDLNKWKVLTHEGAAAGWEAGEVLATYRLRRTSQNEDPSVADIESRVRQARFFFWTSTAQFERWVSFVHRDSEHACGPGKTAYAIASAGVHKVKIFPSIREWRKWVGCVETIASR